MLELDIKPLDLTGFIKKVQIDQDIVVRKIAFEAYDMVTRKTPVDTGRARANWNISARKPDLRTRKVRGEPTGRHKNSFTAPPLPKARPARLRKGDGYEAIYITNNLPYIKKLEFGHSKQAPHGMVRRTMALLRRHYG